MERHPEDFIRELDPDACLADLFETPAREYVLRVDTSGGIGRSLLVRSRRSVSDSRATLTGAPCARTCPLCAQAIPGEEAVFFSGAELVHVRCLHPRAW